MKSLKVIFPINILDRDFSPNKISIWAFSCYQRSHTHKRNLWHPYERHRSLRSLIRFFHSRQRDASNLFSCQNILDCLNKLLSSQLINNVFNKGKPWAPTHNWSCYSPTPKPHLATDVVIHSSRTIHSYITAVGENPYRMDRWFTRLIGLITPLKNICAFEVYTV